MKDLAEVREKLVLVDEFQETLSMSKLEGADRTKISPNLERYEFIGNCLNYEVLVIDSISNNDWRKSIIEYLANPTRAVD